MLNKRFAQKSKLSIIENMRVKLAKSTGFCIGVKRAVELVLRIADEHRGKKIFTLGPLIHNPQTIAMLEEKGIGVLRSPDDAEPNSIVVIRSHGARPQDIEKLISRGAEIFDATCPKVALVHKIVKKFSSQGYATIVIGDPDHAEVIGIMGEAVGDVVAVNSPDEIDKLPNWNKVLVVAQTTMDYRTFDRIVAKIKEKYKNVIVRNTLCSETSFRQDEVEKLSEDCDAFVVVGGRNSANTKRLYKLASETGKPTFWVETAAELKPEDFIGIDCVAVVAGASTPHWIIDNVVDRLEAINRKFAPPWKWHWVKNIAYTVLRSNLYMAFSSFLFSLAISSIFSVPEGVFRALITSAAVFTAQNFYEFREWQGLALMDPSKVQFVRKNRTILLYASHVALIVAVVLTIFSDVRLKYLVLCAFVLMAIYRWSANIERLLPTAVKDSLLISVWIFFTWAIGGDYNPKALVPILGIALLRAIALGLKDLESDRILQRKSITAKLGEHATLRLNFSIFLLATISTLALGPRQLWLVLGYIMLFAISVLIYKKVLWKSTYIETLLDGIIIAISIGILA